jgi:fluoroacetyl-CoA thioesterase
MKPTLQAGLEHTFSFRVTKSKTVPALYPEAREFEAMPSVFATGFLVGLVEWTCIQAVNPHLDWPAEMTLGTHVNLSHTAPTPPGLDVTVRVKLAVVDGKRLRFDVDATDGVDPICSGSHERFVIGTDKFEAKVARKAEHALSRLPPGDAP